MRFLPLLVLSACSQSIGIGPHSQDPGSDPDIDPVVSDPTLTDPGDPNTTTASALPGACETPAALGSTALMSAYGPLQGRMDQGTVTLQGVPYAAPPVDDLRFRPPEPPSCWTEPRQARDYGPICPQVLPLGAVATQDEDCLSLNVWTPALDDGARPVLVFVHGGANAVGSAQDLFESYDGSALAKAEDVVVVTLQYRLGALGFLAHPGLRAQGDPSGNQGLLDQQLALRWVAEHAEALGGDPSRVLLFGESAGAWNTCMHLASPGSRGLFSAALMESGACTVRSLQEAEESGLRAAEQLGCPTSDEEASLECLRGASALELSLLADLPAFDDTWAHLRWGPTLDGTVVPEEPLQAFREGRHAGVPVLVGSNAQEGELFTPPLLTCIETGLFIDVSFGDLAPVIRDLYPCLGSGLIPRWSVVDAVTDASFSCHARRTLTALHEGGAPVWRYVYSYTRIDPIYIALRAFHGGELALVFGTHDRLGYLPPQGEDALSSAMMAAWAGLARDGDPGFPQWNPGSDMAMGFDATLTQARLEPVSRFREEQCDALDLWLF